MMKGGELRNIFKRSYEKCTKDGFTIMTIVRRKIDFVGVYKVTSPSFLGFSVWSLENFSDIGVKSFFMPLESLIIHKLEKCKSLTNKFN